MRITAQDCLHLDVCDEIVPEPACGAHRDHAAAFANLDAALSKHLAELNALSPEDLRSQRYDRFRALGSFIEA